MSGAKAIAEVFIIAFKSLPKQTRDAIIARLAEDPTFLKDLQDFAGRPERTARASRRQKRKKS